MSRMQNIPTGLSNARIEISRVSVWRSKRYLKHTISGIMYINEITLVLIVIPMAVISEIWYPVITTDQNSPAFVLANTFNPSNRTSHFQTEKANANSDRNVLRYNWVIEELKKGVVSPNQTTNSEQSRIALSYGNVSTESHKNQMKEDIGFISDSISDMNDVNFSDLASSLRKKESIGKVKNNMYNRSSRVNAVNGDDTRKSRFLDVFQVVEFEQVLCSSPSGLEGRCLHDYDCQTAGGSPMGACADGYGICCVIVFSCHDHTSEPVGWFTNPDYPLPNTDRLSCALTLNKTSQDVTQIRLDFAKFELLSPTGGSCEDDQFVVSGQNINNVIPILCGINSGQHVYIEVGDTEGPIRLTIQTVAAENRLFSIKVTQVTRSDSLAAPGGCLQHFKGPHGYIESFNYRNISEATTTNRPSYMNNLNYAICIEREASSCSITYTNEDEMQIVNYDTDGLPIIPPRQAGVEIFNCPSDWLLISAVRLCGERLNDGSVLQDFYLNAPVTDIGAGPITIWFRSDEGYVGRGFKLQYQQNHCTISK